MSMKFYGFSGRPAKSVADCSWDFFGCTKRLGYWPKNKKCCQERFDDCCMIVMGKRPMVTTTSTTTTVTTTKIPQISTTAKPSQIHVAQRPQDRIELSKLQVFNLGICKTLLTVGFWCQGIAQKFFRTS